MDLKTYQSSFSEKLDQTLNAHITRVVEDPISSLEVSERRYDTFCPPKGSHVILGVDRIAQKGIRSAFYHARLPQETTFIGSSGIFPP